ncbi:epidermal growth factor receptor-like [Phyllobates terribilis]|uniref:epidermal growth factor receptor-like n=1 Tax=Phyllobates terribilis TaxID=111132 RepID=UPI003CCB6A24
MKAFSLDLEHQRLSIFLTIFLLFISQSCNADVDKKVCLGTNYKSTKLGTTEEHYNQLKDNYGGCEIVLGNLEITHLQSHHDTSFLKEIQEVQGYVLIVANSVKTIPLINLRIIRGINLYKNSALYISSNIDENNVAQGLEELPMRRLKEILEGGVTIANNPKLCYLDIIKWNDIVHSGNDIDIKQSSISNCPTCLEACNGSCWGSGPESCQILTKLICAQQCPGRCRGPEASDCCHSQCAAGCTGPKETDCLACLKFRDGNTCLESCSSTNTYNLRKNLVEAGTKKYSCGFTCVKKCPYKYVVSDSGSCTHPCDLNTFEIGENNVYNCKNYEEPCEKALKSDWTKFGDTPINNVLKENTYILKPRKETYNITSKVDRPKVDVLNAIHVLHTNNKKVCSGSRNLLTQIGGVENHYNFLKNIYQGCKIVLGNLEITHVEAGADVSFFKDIQEVGGYVLIAVNEVKSIPLVNLRVIRGETLYKNTSLSIFSNYKPNSTDGLKELPMRQLQEIIRGDINIRKNPRLCNLHTINWKDIVHSNYSISMNYSSLANCSQCDIACHGSCWGSGPDNCQIFTKLTCDQTCPGRCRGPKPSDCCDCKCAAGCKGPKETDCLACKLVRDNYDKCLEFCPPLDTFNDTFPVESNIKGDSCVIKCPIDYMVTDSGTCVQKCSKDSYMVEEYGALRCKKCDGPCPEGKICYGIGHGKLKQALAINASNIDDFENCTIVLGSVILSMVTLSDAFTKTPVIDPAKLNILRSIREITGHLVVMWLPEMYTDLSLFENLEVIRGRPKLSWKYALAVTSVSISSLGLKSLKEVSDGDVVIRHNKDLCYSDTINWTKIFRTKQQKIKMSNKSPEECDAEGKICDPLCSDDGCWGPGPSQCFSCSGKECVQ